MTTIKPLLTPRFILILFAGVLLLLPMTVTANEFPPPDGIPAHSLQINEDANADFAPWCPSTGALCRVNRDWTIEELQDQLGARQTAVWQDGDTLNFAYRGRVDDVVLRGGVSTELLPVGNSDYWVASLRIKNLNYAVITHIIGERRGDRITFLPSSHNIWRGPLAPDRPQMSLDGYIYTNYLYSPSMDAMRLVSTYVPPNYDRTNTYPIVYMANGENLRSFASVAEPLMRDGVIPPILIMGVHSSSSNYGRLQRLEEYMLGFNDEVYEAHETFFTEYIVRWSELGWGASEDPDDKALFGFSIGATFAGNTGVRQPEVFGNVISFSSPQRPTLSGRTQIDADYYLLAGTLETSIYTENQRAFFTLLLLGVDASFSQWVSGHDYEMWQGEFVNALRWMFSDDD